MMIARLTMLNQSSSVLTLLQEKNLSIKRLRRIVFGPRTERTNDVLSRQVIVNHHPHTSAAVVCQSREG